MIKFDQAIKRWRAGQRPGLRRHLYAARGETGSEPGGRALGHRGGGFRAARRCCPWSVSAGVGLPVPGRRADERDPAPPSALAAKVTRSTGAHRAVFHAGSLPEGRGAVRARTFGDFGRQSAEMQLNGPAPVAARGHVLLMRALCSCTALDSGLEWPASSGSMRVVSGPAGYGVSEARALSKLPANVILTRSACCAGAERLGAPSLRNSATGQSEVRKLLACAHAHRATRLPGRLQGPTAQPLAARRGACSPRELPKSK